MGMSNRERVGKGLDILKEGLAPFIRRELKLHYKGGWFVEGVEPYLKGTIGIDAVRHEGPDEEKFEKLDVQALFTVMWDNWYHVFKNRLGHTGRSYVSELREFRNQWAHQRAFSLRDTQRALDTMHRLLQAVGSQAEVDELEKMIRELTLAQLEEEQRKSRNVELTKVATLSHLKPWREVAMPHQDVAQGRFQEAEFAADLSQVIRREAAPEYQDPMEFFRRTYLTSGLSDLLKLAVARLTGKGGAPVVQLQTSFGGGKTHTMLALYHLFSGQIHLDELAELKRVVAEVDDELPIANRAVIVGTQISPFDVRKYPDGVVTRTLWGEMAYQLGGKEGYEMVREEDEKGISPGSDKIKDLFDRFGPVLVLIDEWVAFARNLYGVDDLPCGTFDANLTFVQALTEGAKRVKDALVVASIPESDIEVGGEGGRAALERLQHTFGRLETIWKPASKEESMEIVRRRLFAQVDESARDAVIREFMAMYYQHKADFPQETQSRDYEYRMRIAYPIHPELFNRLYEDWSTLERFQRTRGVLRLMAIIIHRLWESGDRSLLIMPGTIPLDSSRVSSEMTRYLPNNNWDAVIDGEVDGQHSRPLKMDNENPHLGRCSAARRVARTIFVGSAPKNTDKGNRGIEEVRIKLGCVQPGEQTVVFGDALRRLLEELNYIYSDNRRYWFDTHPSVNRIASERAEKYLKEKDLKEKVDAEIIRRLRSIRSKGEFIGVHYAPQISSDVSDEAFVRLVLLGPGYTHRKDNKESRAIQFAGEILESRGKSARIHRNMLAFVAPDAGKEADLIHAVSYYLAWKSIKDDSDSLNLDAFQSKQVKNSIEHFNTVVDARIHETYDWLLLPKQQGTGEVTWQEYRLSTVTGEDMIVKAGRKMVNEQELITKWNPALLSMELGRWIWRDQLHVPMKQIWGYFTQYLYLPRLKNQDVFIHAVEEGLASKDFFGYAHGVDENGVYIGFKFGEMYAKVNLDNSSVLIKPDVARLFWAQQKEKEGTGHNPPDLPGGGTVTDGGDGTDPKPPVIDPEPGQALPKRVIITSNLDSNRYVKEISLFFEEVLDHLKKLPGARLEVRLDAEVSVPEGVPENVQRTVRENGRNLKMNVEFYEE
ncbi:Swt1 family HEPN domain-containing protein [Staphylospora marina]|uniref:Swt1 family HEPN domain-containing protein n=1 Tax=Staphylospora marina TaxID=2490858 RepID=UPI000F5BEE1E|nr:Swt1 family HEPN domain-containing protein [Staphylospora marina]